MITLRSPARTAPASSTSINLPQEFKLATLPEYDQISEKCIQQYGLEATFKAYLTEKNLDIKLSLLAVFLKNDRLLELAKQKELESTESKSDATLAVSVFTNLLLALGHMLDYCVTAEEIKDSNQQLALILNYAIDELLDNRNNIELLNSFRRKRIENKLNEIFFEQLGKVNIIRNNAKNKIFKNYLNNEIDKARDVITRHTIAKATALHQITSGAIEMRVALEEKTKSELGKHGRTASQTWALSSPTTSSRKVIATAVHQSTLLEIKAGDEDNHITSILQYTSGLINTFGDEETVIQTIKQITDINLANAIKICLKHTNTTAKIAFANSLLTQEEHLKKIMQHSEIDELVDILAKEKPELVYILFQKNQKLAEPILKSINMRRWLFDPIKSDHLEKLLQNYKTWFETDNNLKKLSEVFNGWELTQFNQALRLALPPNYINLLRWAKLSQKNIVNKLTSDNLDAELKLLKPFLTRNKLLALFEPDFTSAPKSEGALSLLLGIYPVETVNYLAGEIKDTNKQQRVAWLLLEELHAGYWKLPEASEVHNKLNSERFFSTNYIGKLVEFGIYKAENSLSSGLSNNTLVVKHITNDLTGPCNFLNTANRAAFEFVLSNEAILSNLTFEQLRNLHHCAIDHKFPDTNFKLIGEKCGSKSDFDKFLEESKDYESPALFSSMIAGAVAGVVLALNHLRQNSSPILLGAAAGAGISFGTVFNLSLFILLSAAAAGAIAGLIYINARQSVRSLPETIWDRINGRPSSIVQIQKDAFLFHNMLRHTPAKDLRNHIFHSSESRKNFFNTMKKFKDTGYKFNDLPPATKSLVDAIVNYENSSHKLKKNWIYSMFFPLIDWLYDIRSNFDRQLRLKGAVTAASSSSLKSSTGVTLKAFKEGQESKQETLRADLPAADLNMPSSSKRVSSKDIFGETNKVSIFVPKTPGRNPDTDKARLSPGVYS